MNEMYEQELARIEDRIRELKKMEEFLKARVKSQREQYSMIQSQVNRIKDKYLK
jgi:chaperonin cofactor prefoldin